MSHSVEAVEDDGAETAAVYDVVGTTDGAAGVDDSKDGGLARRSNGWVATQVVD